MSVILIFIKKIENTDRNQTRSHDDNENVAHCN